MKLRERVAFAWSPDEPTDAFECVLIAGREALQARAFAVTVTAKDVDGLVIPPLGDRWSFSNSLSAYFKYSPASDINAGARIESWAGSAIVDSVSIEAVAWTAEDSDVPDVTALGISAVPSSSFVPRTWHILRPQEGDRE